MERRRRDKNIYIVVTVHRFITVANISTTVSVFYHVKLKQSLQCHFLVMFRVNTELGLQMTLPAIPGFCNFVLVLKLIDKDNTRILVKTVANISNTFV